MGNSNKQVEKKVNRSVIEKEMFEPQGHKGHEVHEVSQRIIVIFSSISLCSFHPII